MGSFFCALRQSCMTRKVCQPLGMDLSMPWVYIEEKGEMVETNERIDRK